MKFFLDTEFVEDGRTIEPISVGIVTQRPGVELYLELQFDEAKARANPFVRENVLPHLSWEPAARLTREQAAERILWFARTHADALGVEFWAYFADYDWVLLAQLFGRMVDLPRGFPHMCLDLQQHWRGLGYPEIKPEQPADQHNALADARWNKRFYEAMQSYVVDQPKIHLEFPSVDAREQFLLWYHERGGANGLMTYAESQAEFDKRENPAWTDVQPKEVNCPPSPTLKGRTS